MTDDRVPTEERRGLSRRRLLERAGLAAATMGLTGCGVAAERQQTVSGNVDARDLSAPPPSQPPLNCHIFSFFTLPESQTVDAFTARIVPGDAADPGAREACVVTYIDAKLAQFPAFATPTYFEAPFAKPTDASPGPQPGATKQILVAKKDLGRYGFQSGLTPQQTYRQGLVQLDRFAQAKHNRAFVELSEAEQDEIVKALETANPDPPSVVRKVKDLADPRAALAKAKVKHAEDLKTPEQKLLARIFVKPSAYGFFATLQQDTIEGMFADPVYGGNRDFAGWRLLSYPGAQRAWTPRELTHGPNHRTIQGLAQMPPMNPGVPQDHVILPIEGTRRTAS